jgi:hypothetical protein
MRDDQYDANYTPQSCLEQIRHIWQMIQHVAAQTSEQDYFFPSTRHAMDLPCCDWSILARGGRNAFFSVAFLILAADSVAHALITLQPESLHILLEVRLLAFGLIIAGVVDKNRSRR